MTADSPEATAAKRQKSESPASRKAVKIILPILILALGIGGFIALIKSKPKAEPKQVEERTWVVDTLTIELQRLAPVLSLYGQVDAPRLANLSATINADVLQVNVNEGQRVDKGSLLLTLDAREAKLVLAQRQADVAEADAAITSEKRKHQHDRTSLPHERALLAFAEKAVARAKKLERQQVASQSALDDAERTVEQQKLIIATRQLAIATHPAQLAQLQARRDRTQALLELAQLDVERTQIRAPYAGIINRVHVAPGDRVRIGAQLIDMYAPEELEVRVQIPNQERTRLQTLLAESTALPASAEDGVMLKLQRLSGSVNTQAGGIDALLSIEQGAEKLRLGQFLNVYIQLPAQNDLVALPYEAVYSGDHVFALQDNRLHRMAIEMLGSYVDSAGASRLLAHSPDWQAGDVIVATQLPNAVEGLKVSPKQ
jgi:RND family efflux transporter MFP subunit